MRVILYIILIGIALALLRWLIMDVVGAVKRALGPSEKGDFQTAGQQRSDESTGKRRGNLVRDPVSGTYFDERTAIRETIDGKVYFFESRENRDAYLRKTRPS